MLPHSARPAPIHSAVARPSVPCAPRHSATTAAPIDWPSRRDVARMPPAPPPRWRGALLGGGGGDLDPRHRGAGVLRAGGGPERLGDEAAGAEAEAHGDHESRPRGAAGKRPGGSAHAGGWNVQVGFSLPGNELRASRSPSRRAECIQWVRGRQAESRPLPVSKTARAATPEALANAARLRVASAAFSEPCRSPACGRSSIG